MKKRTMIFTAAALTGTAVLFTQCDEAKPPPARTTKIAHIATEDLFVYDRQGRNGNMIGVLERGGCILLNGHANSQAPMGQFIIAEFNAPEGVIRARVAEGRLKPASRGTTADNCTVRFYQTLATPDMKDPMGLAIGEIYQTTKPAQLYSMPGKPITGQFAEAGSCLRIDLPVKPEKDYFAIKAAGKVLVEGYVLKKDVRNIRDTGKPCFATLRVE